MSFWNRLKMSIAHFMNGRYGADQLCLVSMWTAVILTLLGSLSGLGILSTLSTVLFVWTLFRMLSRNVVKRRMENDKFNAWYAPLSARVRQYVTRLKNSRKYKYFRCPQCKSLLKLPRKVGQVTMTCGKCGHEFKQKA